MLSVSNICYWSSQSVQRQEKLDLFAAVAESCQLVISRVHAGEHRILKIIQSAEDLCKRVQEFGNALPFLYASRLIMLPGRRDSTMSKLVSKLVASL